MPSYNLTAENWIPVLLKNGQSAELSLLGVIERAEDVAQISGNPLEAAVIHRLLLAIAHRVSHPQDEWHWLDIWNDRTRLIRSMAKYVSERTELFDLYDERRPFAQNPHLPEPSSTPATLVYERAQGNNPVFLDASVVADPKPISSSQAARSLLVTHAYAGSGTGSNNPLNGGKKDTMRAGPLCARMIALIEGDDLAKTITLNLADGPKPGLPGWERSAADKPIQTASRGLADLYTRATRSAKLAPSADGKECLAVSLFMGEGVEAEEGQFVDPMIPLYFQERDKKFKALRLSPDKALWRNSQTLLAPQEHEFARPLRVVQRLSLLLQDREIEMEDRLRLRVLGVAADAQGPVTELWRDEALRCGISLFKHCSAYADLVRSVADADTEEARLRKRLYAFASSYVGGAGGNANKDDVAKLMDEIAPRMDGYWSRIAPAGERIALETPDQESWLRRLRKAAADAFEEAVSNLAPDARRYRAQFARAGRDDEQTKSKRKKTQ